MGGQQSMAETMEREACLSGTVEQTGLPNLVNQPFTIISDNCWGSRAYTERGMPYLTPFVGLFLLPASYLALLHDFPSVMRSPLELTNQTRDEVQSIWREKERNFYPIGRLGREIEIHFLHYSSPEEAAEKWRRRTARMLWDESRQFVKFCDHARPSPEQLRDFDRLPFRNKVCFRSSRSPLLDCGVYLPGYENEGRVPDGWQLYPICLGRFDMSAWLNGASGRKSYMRRACDRLARAVAGMRSDESR
jgi:uncharacterized protein (DUF1919 family)